MVCVKMIFTHFVQLIMFFYVGQILPTLSRQCWYILLVWFLSNFLLLFTYHVCSRILVCIYLCCAAFCFWRNEECMYVCMYVCMYRQVHPWTVKMTCILFKTVNNEIICECCSYFKFQLPSELLDKRRDKFQSNFMLCTGILHYFGIKT